MTPRILLIVGTLILANQAAAACVASDPVATARWIYANQVNSPTYQFPQDMRLMKSFISPRLLALLEVEWPCQVVSEGPCAVDTDPWTNAKNGKALEPTAFSVGSYTGSRSTVRVTFRLASDDGDSPRPFRAQARLMLVRDAKSGCWLLDDLVGMKGMSLVKQLQSYAALYP